MRRFFIDPGAVREGKIYIEDAGDVRHIKNVLRMKPGDELTLCDGTGRAYEGAIEEIGDMVSVSVTDIKYAVAPRTKITLYQCVPKQGKMETIIQKSTELGAVRFVPVFSARSVPKPKNADAKITRWQRIAEEAAKQSGRSVIPVVDIPLSISDASETFGEYDLTLFPYENEDRTTIKDVLREYLETMKTPGAEAPLPPEIPDQWDTPQSEPHEEDACSGIPQERVSAAHPHIAVIIGPEGGFTDAEAFRLIDAGARPCSLGGTILRTETAGPASIAMALYEMEL
ncbi:MAG: 16S rRNA (uracil(1498)-N(3))-methyltransferase [Clostridiales Family XIII bacterium]|jgi:16S rRNA (uracil1498-N3)-methyltransferase|nr:16S rRNA (uracil(1498)-N(3))-methyltransferase [Clostridiales Family XIII bacterium]